MSDYRSLQIYTKKKTSKNSNKSFNAIIISFNLNTFSDLFSVLIFALLIECFVLKN